MKFFQQALVIDQRLAEADPKNAQAQRNLSLSQERLGDITSQLNDFKAALKYFQQALAIRQRLADDDLRQLVFASWLRILSPKVSSIVCWYLSDSNTQQHRQLLPVIQPIVSELGWRNV